MCYGSNVSKSDERTVEVGLEYGHPLSHVARGFGARSRREARNYPGDYGRPYVGQGAEYYSRAVKKIMNIAVGSNPDLLHLYTEGSRISRIMADEMQPWGYLVGGPSHKAAGELVRISAEIKPIIDDMKLRLPLSGKWLNRATSITEFSLRVIDGRSENLDFVGLYPGLDHDYPENTSEFWNGLLVELHSDTVGSYQA